MIYREQVKALYDIVNSGSQVPPFPTPRGHHEAIWDAISLLASRMDGDMTSNPREQRDIGEWEFVDGISQEDVDDRFDEGRMMEDLQN